MGYQECKSEIVMTEEDVGKTTMLAGREETTVQDESTEMTGEITDHMMTEMTQKAGTFTGTKTNILIIVLYNIAFVSERSTKIANIL